MGHVMALVGFIASRRQFPLVLCIALVLIAFGLDLVLFGGVLTVADTLGLIAALTLQMLILYLSAIITKIYPLVLHREATASPEVHNWTVSLIIAGCPAVGILTGLSLWMTLLALVVFVVHAARVGRHYSGLGTWTHAQLPGLRSDFFVFTGGGQNNTYQLTQWLPVLEQSAHRFCIICDNPAFAAALPKTDLPVLISRNLIGNEMAVIGAAPKGVLYTGNPRTNTGFLRFAQLQHVFINHGESDKVVNQSKLLQAYDRLFLAGPMAQQRLTDAGIALREGQAVHIGRPPVELDLTRLTDPAGPVRRVLYAPTWEGLVKEADYTSVRAEGFAMLEALLAVPDLEVTVKLHPLTGSKSQAQAVWRKRMLALCQQRGVTVHGPDYPIHTAMNDSDLLICDISSVLNDYLYTGKPIVLCHFGEMPVDQVRDEFASAQAAAILTDPAQTAQALSDSTGPQMTAARAAVAEASLSLSRGGMMDRFDAALAQLKQD
ncbi:CDP-glycerol glycerophosphotransferase family protein [Loktanella sp. TSTF-M6]|uniref:CDP-glycerol glycerophosphotransferase family protein n=1 Tax=Loktanella gaetbuli TaxID=2881335 RepID=A0ABS8BYR7_9RHOB|nr:CDP-glycerol glycerophosphotransferase family protein [Loktanella gaetbuli]MCB5200671.1 CDP-glycerol glycerophosphotransferase family protein [Loktanella gaetbuli]